MKKSLILIITVLVSAACSDYQTVTDDRFVTISVRANASETYTRSGADETVPANRCILEIYNADGTPYDKNMRLTASADASGAFNFEPSLLAGRSYRLVLWAYTSDSNGGDLYYDTSRGLRDITLKDGVLTACDADADAFYVSTEFKADKSQTITETLRRAVCRVNVATGFTPAPDKDYSVTVSFANVPSGFDAMTGEVTGVGAATSTADVAVESAAVEWFAYLLAPAERTSVDFVMSVTASGDSEPQFKYSFSQIPLQRNYRVNVSIVPSAETVICRPEILGAE